MSRLIPTWRSTTCGAICAPILAICLAPATVLADFTTDDTLSIEWIVHSSDAIYLVGGSNPKQEGTPGQNEKMKVLREPLDQAESVLKVVNELGPLGGEWLVFVRTWEDRPPNIFYRVNLTRPLTSPWTAAINAKGVPLATRSEILNVVNERLKRQRMSDRQRAVRESVDKVRDYAGDRYSLEKRLGGFLVPINCDLWDNPSQADVDYEISDEDLGLTGVVVPADPEYRDELLRAARAGKVLEARRVTAALINYPGPETDDLLENLIQSKRGAWGVAQDVAWFFRYRYDLSDPLHQELVGRWELLGHRERIDITLSKDGTFIATSFARKRSGQTTQLWRGRGYWLIHDHTLTLYRHGQYRVFPGQSSNQPRWYYVPRTIFQDKPVLSNSPDTVQLEHGPPMTRLDE